MFRKDLFWTFLMKSIQLFRWISRGAHGVFSYETLPLYFSTVGTDSCTFCWNGDGGSALLCWKQKLPSDISELLLSSLQSKPDLQVSLLQKKTFTRLPITDSETVKQNFATCTSLLAEAACFCSGHRHVNPIFLHFLSNLISHLLATNKGETNPSKSLLPGYFGKWFTGFGSSF